MMSRPWQEFPFAASGIFYVDAQKKPAIVRFHSDIADT